MGLLERGANFVDAQKTSLKKQHTFTYMWTTQWVEHEEDGVFIGKIPRIIKVPTNTPVYGGDAVGHNERYFGYVRKEEWPQEIADFHEAVLEADSQRRPIDKSEIEGLTDFYAKHIEAKKRGDHKGNFSTDARGHDNPSAISGKSGKKAVGRVAKTQNRRKAKSATR